MDIPTNAGGYNTTSVTEDLSELTSSQISPNAIVSYARRTEYRLAIMPSEEAVVPQLLTAEQEVGHSALVGLPRRRFVADQVRHHCSNARYP